MKTIFNHISIRAKAQVLYRSQYPSLKAGVKKFTRQFYLFTYLLPKLQLTYLLPKLQFTYLLPKLQFTYLLPKLQFGKLYVAANSSGNLRFSKNGVKERGMLTIAA